MKKYWFLLSFVILGFSACQQDEDSPSIIDLVGVFEDGFFILNEGGFTHNNASLDFYNYMEDSLYKDIYLEQNQEQLGDILQSAYKVESGYYFSMNNSGKIIFTDSLINKASSISNLVSPRYMAFFESKAFISDLYAELIYVADLNTNTVSNTIPTGSWSEGIITQDSFIISCLPSQNELILINAHSEEIIHTLSISGNPSAILEDNNKFLWVLGSGDYLGTDSPTLSKLEIKDQKLEIVFSEDIEGETAYFPRICFNPNQNEVYLAIDDSIYKQACDKDIFDMSLLFQTEAINIYGLDFEPTRNEILISDAIDYVQRGIIFRYDIDGTKLSSFKAGIIPSGFITSP